MMECVTMETNQEILIRNKNDARKLSKQIVESAKHAREEKYLEALEDGNRLYLNSIYESLSIWELLKIAVRKS